VTAHLLFAFTTFATGGPQRLMVGLMNHWGKGYRYSVAAFDNRFEALDLLDPGIPVRRLPLRLSKSPAAAAANLRYLRGFLRDSEADILLTLNWGSIELALANRFAPSLPQLHQEAGFGREESPERQLGRRVLVRRLALSGRHQSVIVPSATLERLARRRWKLDDVTLIRNGIDVDRFRSAPPVPDRPLTVGTVCALRPEKNLARLVRAVAELPELRLEIVGDGPERAALELLAETLGVRDRVVFAGHLASPEQAYPRFDIFALSSDTEQMPLTLMEAMAHGVAVAATDVGDIAEMVAPENRAYVTPLGDDAAFVAALRGLARAPELRARLAAANRTRAAAEFTFKRAANAYAEAIERRIAGGLGDAGLPTQG